MIEMFWHLAYELTDAGPEPFPCFCLEEEHDDLMQFVGTYPDDFRPAPRDLQNDLAPL